MLTTRGAVDAPRHEPRHILSRRVIAAPLASRAAVDQDRSMRTRTTSTILAVGAVVLTSPVAAAQAPEHGSCAAFGGNVGGLATTLGPLFGATASGVASSGPAAFPTLVVRPEQAALCEPRP
jgi:hypothetical protein